MPAATLGLLYHEDLRRSPRVRAAVAFVDAVIAANRAALVPDGFSFDLTEPSARTNCRGGLRLNVRQTHAAARLVGSGSGRHRGASLHQPDAAE